MIFVVFGLPGTGKTFVGKLLNEKLGYYYYEGDTVMPDDIKDAVFKKQAITDEQRDVFFKRLIEEIKKLQETQQNIVVSQTFIKEQYRQQFLQAFPDTQFLLVETDTPIREGRLEKRKSFPIDKEYARAMCKIFETPKLTHKTINNTAEGEEEIKKQIDVLLENITLE